jgi:hypothetical protein
MSAGDVSAAPGRGRIDAGPVLAEATGGLARQAGVLPWLAWPALAVALGADAVAILAFAPDSVGGGLVRLLHIPFDLMLATALARLLLLGRNAVRRPAVGWGRAETDLTFAAVVFTLAFVALVVLAVLIVGNLPLAERTLTWVVAAASWLILTMLTPLALKVPAGAVQRSVPGRAWQARLGNFAGALLVWLAFLAAAFVLRLIPAQLPPADAGVGAQTLRLVVQTLVDYAVLAGFVAVVAAMARHLAGWPPPDDGPA